MKDTKAYMKPHKLTSVTHALHQIDGLAVDVAVIGGYALVCNSALTMIAGAFGIACFLLMPFPEEPWLREPFGEDYDTSSPAWLVSSDAPGRTQLCAAEAALGNVDTCLESALAPGF